MGVTLIFAGLLALVVISLIRSWQTREDEQIQLRRSNARVLREYKQIALHRPHYIITTERKHHDHQ